MSSPVDKRRRGISIVGYPRNLRERRTYYESSGDESDIEENLMATFLIWLVLLIVCWPLALLALVLYPIIWLILLPFRLLGIAVESVFELLRAILMLPARILGGPGRV